MQASLGHDHVHRDVMRLRVDAGNARHLERRVLLHHDWQGRTGASRTPLSDQEAGIELTLERPVQGHEGAGTDRKRLQQNLGDDRVVPATHAEWHRHAPCKQLCALLTSPSGTHAFSMVAIGDRRQHPGCGGKIIGMQIPISGSIWRAGVVPRVAGRVAALLLALALVPLAAFAGCDDAPGPGVDWNSCEKYRLLLRKADLRGAKLGAADLNGSDLESANLAGADLSRASVDRVRLSNAELGGARLVQLSAYRTNFTKARFLKADLTKAELSRSNFTDADLTGANLTKAELPRAVLQGAALLGANLTGADLSRTNLANAKLAGAKLAQARMFRTRVDGVDLSLALGLVQGQIDTTCGDAKTVLPKGLKAPATWPCAKED